MNAEDRHMYELEAAMVYYGTIIQNKFARGEEVTDQDLINVDNATDAYEEYIKPGLSIEETVEAERYSSLI